MDLDLTHALLQMIKESITIGDDRLRDHVEQQIASVETALLRADKLERERVEAIKEMAVERAKAQEAAFKEMSQSIGSRFERLETVAASHLTSDEYDRRHEALELRIGNLEQWRANLIGRYVGIAVIGMIAVAVIAGFITHLFS